MYKYTVNYFKRTYRNKKVQSIFSAKNSKEFWHTINTYRRKSDDKSGTTSKGMWFNFFSNYYSPSNETSRTMELSTFLNPILGTDEIYECIADCKCGKAAAA